MAALVKKRSASSLSDSRSSPLERTTKRRKRTYFSGDQLDRLEQAFKEDQFPGIDRRDALAKELGIGEDRIHVWFQNRRSRWRKREIKNKPAPVTSPAPVDSSPISADWAPKQFPVYCQPPHFPSTSGVAHVPATNNMWGFNMYDRPAYYFPSEIPATNTARSSVFAGPSFSFVYGPCSPVTSSEASPVTAVAKRPCSDQGGQRSSPLCYDSDSTESRHSADEYLAAMSLLSVFSREN